MTTKFKSTGNIESDRLMVVDWWMYVYNPNNEIWYNDENRQSVFESWSNALEKLFNFIKIDTYCQETNQSEVILKTYKKIDALPQLSELNVWLKHIKTHKNLHLGPSTREINCDKSKYGKSISIFEHTLSEMGFYTLWVYSDNDIELIKTTWNVESLVKKFNNLFSAILYIKDRHYYQKRLPNLTVLE